MGSVYLARHPRIGKKVAVKILHEHLHHRDDIVRRFFSEARLVNSIGHPNIVDVLDCDTATVGGERVHYILMEYLPGQSLRTLIKRDGPLHPGRATVIARQVCDALHAAHERGIVHRDIKPDNIFLTARSGETDKVKLLDFGIAKLLDAAVEGNRTATGVVIGTTAYMSPEQLHTEPTIDRRSDIYSLGVALFESLTGRRPDLKELTSGSFVAELRDVHGAGAVADVVEHALRIDPDERFQNAKAMGEALAQASKDLPPVPVERSSTPPLISSQEIEALAKNVPSRPAPRHRKTAPTVAARPDRSEKSDTAATAATALAKESPSPAQSSSAAVTEISRGSRKLWPVVAGVLAIGVAVLLAVLNAGEEPAPIVAVDAGVRLVGASAVDAHISADSAPPTPEPAPSTRTVELTSTPSEAKIHLDGEVVGKTPFKLEVPTGRVVTVNLRKNGYSSARVKIDASARSPIHRKLQRKRSSKLPASKPTSKSKDGPKRLDDSLLKPSL